jgi:hypothetical protein
MKSNLMDVQHLLLKALILRTGAREVRMGKDVVLPAQDFDLQIARSRINGDVILRIVPGNGSDPNSALIIPNDPNESPLISPS